MRTNVCQAVACQGRRGAVWRVADVATCDQPAAEPKAPRDVPGCAPPRKTTGMLRREPGYFTKHTEQVQCLA